MDHLTGAMEENVLTAVCWNDELAAEIILKVDWKLFSSRPYQTIAKIAYQHFERYREAPKAHLPDLLERELAKDESGQLLAKTIRRMQELEPHLQPAFVRDSLNEWIDSREFMTAINEAADLAHHGKIDQAREQLVNFKVGKAITAGIWMHDTERFLRFMQRTEDDDMFSSGIDLLDSRGIRPKRKGMMLMVAPAKVGKSWFLVNVGKAGILRRHKVLHVTLEMPEDEVAQRYVMAMFAMTERQTGPVISERFLKSAEGDFQGFEPSEFMPEALLNVERAVLAERLRHSRFTGNAARPRLLVKEFATGSLTTAALDNYLEMLKRVDGWEPDILILDYVNLLAMDRRNLRTDLGRVYVEVRGICMARNIACVTATQSNREGSSARAVRAEHVSEDWSAIGTADTILTLSKTEEEMERNLARISVMSRNAADRWVAYITQQYPIGQFCIDSIYYSQGLQREMEGISADMGTRPRRRHRA